MTPRLGTDGKHIVYPIRGIVQAARATTTQPHRRTVAYVCALGLTAGVVAASLALLGFQFGSPWVVVALAIIPAIAERISVGFAVAQRGLTKTEEQSIGILPTLIAAVLFGPFAGGVVGAASILGDP